MVEIHIKALHVLIIGYWVHKDLSHPLQVKDWGSRKIKNEKSIDNIASLLWPTDMKICK